MARAGDGRLINLGPADRRALSVLEMMMPYILTVTDEQAQAIVCGLAFLAGAIEVGNTPGPEPLPPELRALNPKAPDPPSTHEAWKAVAMAIAQQCADQDRAQRGKPS